VTPFPELGDHVLPPPPARVGFARGEFFFTYSQKHFSTSSHAIQAFSSTTSRSSVCVQAENLTSSGRLGRDPEVRTKKNAKRNTSRMHHLLPIHTNYLIITLRVIVLVATTKFFSFPLPLIPMAVRPSRARERSFAELTRHFGSSSGVQDYVASTLHLQLVLEQLPS